MIVYRLTTPIDEFDGLRTLPQYLACGTEEPTRWALTALLALADAADTVGWRGDMRHLPSVAEAEDGTPCLIVKQDDLGATFAVCTPAARRLLDDYGPRSVEVQVPDRDIPHASHPTAQEIAEALQCPRDRQPNLDIRREAPWAALGGHPF